MKYKINADDVAVDKSLREEDGWNRMQVQWLSTTDTTGSKHAVLGRTVFPPKGASHELHTHDSAEEILYVVSGTGRARVADEEFDIGPRDVVFVPVGAKHFFINTSPTEEMETIWLYGGAGTLEASGYRSINE
ncbi:MAG: cupin domain-containing protein [Christensenellales bacterium]